MNTNAAILIIKFLASKNITPYSPDLGLSDFLLPMIEKSLTIIGKDSNRRNRPAEGYSSIASSISTARRSRRTLFSVIWLPKKGNVELQFLSKKEKKISLITYLQNSYVDACVW